MEIKAVLNKPYTEEQRIDFIIEQNHRNGYEIRETETELQAWGQTNTEVFARAKEAKYAENSQKGEVAREGQAFTITIDETELAFDTTRSTQSDLLTALSFLQAGVPKYDWIDNNGTVFSFTSVEQVALVSATFMEKANIYPKWAYYKALIDNAETLEELDAIVIDYEINLDEVEVEETPDYSSMTVAQLKSLADEKGISYPSNIVKADLIALLQGE